MEVVCDDRLRIWHAMFGTPRAKKGLSIMEQSNLFNAARGGKWPPIRPTISLAGLNLNWFNYLADGMYPDFRIFMKPLSNHRTNEENMYSQHQSAARKAVERVFGVLFSCFQILYRPARLWHKKDLNMVVKACCVIHNMICNSRKESYTGTTKVAYTDEKLDQMRSVDFEKVKRPASTYKQALLWREYLDPIEDTEAHRLLQTALSSHIWNMKGDSLE
ncbi:hypothetical protein BWQ96_03950 [Gracilariopsis chorda]|uniref:DDE Tnp4 domain-containing protein n=1 Tax=Gracilariopsis chorda TaxID=448386 RepID=A0A2V3IVY2_9FLOR|nr:hypothetical protein BWQ96_03950 [Gracilariopsis chorda]|eukprot:PXF46294.1 hypothetical protein BWQ96_03950 [Gracilariopsis chorda]